ncbi:growth hormone-inducible transmembrane protein [Galendromus occidentalis]|uniref:Growth hormone-inducible transmembrane protein n=1 Tax=Galendromus occidentalis TaxID=34638 RepID=A0AAJ6QZB0_9ACAR|nr:growth hormone-inducible transmembrane protein [Galendromus occidentalis]
MLSASRLALSAVCRNSQNALLRTNPCARNFTQRSRLEKIVERRRSLKEVVAKPAGSTAFEIGKGAIAGGSLFGLGALCYYGLTFEPTSVSTRAAIWPEYVKERVRTTYAYFGGGLAITAASAAAIFRSPAAMNLVARNSIPAMIGSIVLIIGSNILVHSLPYEPGLNGKQLAWAGHSALMGAMVAPLCILGGPLLMRAAWYTAGVVGGLSAVACCAPSDKFMNMGGPLAVGLGVVFASSVGSAFLPPTTALGAGLYSMSMYGGLLLFSAFLLYDTQKIMRRAETHPQYGVVPYDPINNSISIYADTLNIFIRIAMLLGGGGSRKK